MYTLPALISALSYFTAFGGPTATMAFALTPPAIMASLDDGPVEPAAVQLTISFDESLST